MKQKSQNRFLAALLAVAMMLQMLPMLAFAAEETTSTAGQPLKAPQVNLVQDNKTTLYDNVVSAVTAAKSGATIELGEGNYTLYNVDSEGKTKGKDLTFVGQGIGITTWRIGT